MSAAAPLRVPVLMYHEIADSTVTDDPLAVAPQVFADQLDYLRDAGFTPVTAAALSSTLADGGQLPERPVAVTFDDGHEDFYTDALPLLKQRGFTGTLFMTTDWVGFVGYGKRMMTWSQLADAVQDGAEIGAHTRSHPKLDQLTETQLRDELCVSKSLLEDNLGTAITGVAYPFGYSSPQVRQIARNAGYTYGCSVGNAMTTSTMDSFALTRLTVKRTTTLDSFRQMVNGHDTLALKRDRMLTKGYSVVRRARATVQAARAASAAPARSTTSTGSARGVVSGSAR